MEVEGENWFYSKEVKDHFINPRNFVKNLEKVKGFNGYGKTGNIKCGDIMEMWVLVKEDKIKECKWRTFGCASAIASTSMLSVMVTENGGMKIEDALKITGKEIMQRLGGLPAIKIHCSVLGDEALREAIKNYQEHKKNKKIQK
jgi:NifU-like protein